MTAALLDAPTALFGFERSTGAAGGRRATLEELLEARWRNARAEGQTECPVCEATMRLENEQARCGGCGTTLS
jgi:hypothetical protein